MRRGAGGSAPTLQLSRAGRSAMGAALGIIALPLFLVYGGAQVYACFTGAEYYLGTACAWLIVLAALWVRSSLPITLGAFFGALQAWGWHWVAATAFAAPGLLLLIPDALPIILAPTFFLVKR